MEMQCARTFCLTPGVTCRCFIGLSTCFIRLSASYSVPPPKYPYFPTYFLLLDRFLLHSSHLLTMGLSVHSPLTHGNLDSNRTSTVSFEYEPRMMPLPWRFLLLSFSLDIVTAFWSAGGWGIAPFCIQKIEARMANIETRFRHKYYTDSDAAVDLEQRPRCTAAPTWCAFKHGFEAVGICISVFRSLAVLILAISAVQTGNSRILSASAVAGLLFSSVPYWVGQAEAGYHHGLLRLAALLASYMSCIAHFIMFVYYHGSYGSLHTTGGNCPVDVRDREKLVRLGVVEKGAVGCGVEKAIKAEYRNKSPGAQDANIVHLVERWPNFGVAAVVYFCLLLLFVCVVPVAVVYGCSSVAKACCCIKKKWLGQERKAAEEDQIPLLDEDSDEENLDVFDQEHETFRNTSFRVPKEALDLAVAKRSLSVSKVALSLISLLAAVSVPTHYMQEHHPRAITVIDNYGPFIKHTNITSPNVTRWTDYFDIRAPSYGSVLVQRWWQEDNCRLCSAIAMV